MRKSVFKGSGAWVLKGVSETLRHEAPGHSPRAARWARIFFSERVSKGLTEGRTVCLHVSKISRGMGSLRRGNTSSQRAGVLPGSQGLAHNAGISPVVEKGGKSTDLGVLQNFQREGGVINVRLQE